MHELRVDVYLNGELVRVVERSFLYCTQYLALGNGLHHVSMSYLTSYMSSLKFKLTSTDSYYYLSTHHKG